MTTSIDNRHLEFPTVHYIQPVVNVLGV